MNELRIVGVLKKKIAHGSKVLVYGPRDVGKSLYVRLAVYSMSVDVGNEKESRHNSEKPHPIFLKCPVPTEIVQNVILSNRFYNHYFNVTPIVILEDAHLCNLGEILEATTYSISRKDVKIVAISPSIYINRKHMFDVQQQIVPLRFVEVLEGNVDIRSVLDSVQHFQGKDRIRNLTSPEEAKSILDKIIEETRNISDYIKHVFSCYLLCGGTAYAVYGVRGNDGCINLCLDGRWDGVKAVRETYFKTVEEILEDAKALDKNPMAVKGLLYFFSTRIREGLMVNEEEIPKKVKNLIERIAPIKIRDDEIRDALQFLRNSGIVARLKAYRISHGPGDTALKESPNAKYVFTDPRYFISAYLHEVHD